MTELNKKKSLGQYFTHAPLWAKPHIIKFIKDSGTKIAFDPFAGNGDLLKFSSQIGYTETYGLDIDEKLNWEKNDSLITIPKLENSIIITNPPYLAKYSAKRKGIYSTVSKYFRNNGYDDLYKVGLNKILEASNYIVAIIPETFINSTFSKDRVKSITILEENPFLDTEVPVCVVCFDNNDRDLKEIEVYKNDQFIGYLGYIENFRKVPKNIININFNEKNGQVALRAVDTTNPNEKIKFLLLDDLDYDRNKIKVSSRLITIIDIPFINNINDFIKICNKILYEYREDISDIILSPFKGNMKDGIRRRRLDYRTARAILEEAYLEINKVN